jgi:CheY-like chemotaxis protein
VIDQLTIFVVEDDIALRDVMLHMLSQHGFAVLVAGTAYEALNILRQRPVDLLLTDIIMPGMDGVDLAKEARKLHPGLKVLFATAYMQVALKRAAAHHGPVLYKPFRDGELVKAVKSLLSTP